MAHYVEREWLPNHVMEDSTRESYTYVINKHVLPHLGTMRMKDLMPWHVRDWISDLAADGVRPPTIRSAKVCLDAILSTAFHDQVTALHAGRGVKTPAVPRKPKTIMTAAHYQLLHDAVGDVDMQTLVETDIETGLRWGELSELRPRDLDLVAGTILVARVVVHLKSAQNTGPRFKVKEYPKDGEWRRIAIADHLVAKLREHIARHGLGPDGLLFPLPETAGAARHRRPAELPDPFTLGRTEPNEKGRTYRHGTLTAYQAGRCRCRHCKDAVATYRAARRAAGKDNPRTRRETTTDTDRHMSNDCFRHNVWNPALAKADLGIHVTPHGMRHAHASWLLAGGRTCRSSRNASATDRSPRRRSTCTPSRTPGRPLWLPWTTSAPPSPPAGLRARSHSRPQQRPRRCSRRIPNPWSLQRGVEPQPTHRRCWQLWGQTSSARSSPDSCNRSSFRLAPLPDADRLGP